MDKSSPKEDGISYQAFFKVFNENFQIDLYHHNIQYSIKSAGDITISDNIKTHEKRITINTRKKSRKGNGKINGTYQLSIFPDNISTLFISRRGTKKYLSFDDFVTIGEGKIDRINQETIHYLKMISGEIPIE